jgi:F-type H+-transporting ATPase subunit b
MDKLGINPGQLIAQLVNFLILFVILAKLVWNPLIKYLEARQTRIAKTIEDAAAAAEARTRAEKEAGEMTTNAKRAAEQYTETERKQATASAEEILKAASEEAEGIREKAREDGEKTLAQKIQEGWKTNIDLAIQGAQRILGVTVVLPENAENLADFLAVPQTAIGIGSDVTITSAVPLPEVKQTEIQHTIGAVNVTWHIDPSIIGGLVYRSGTTVVDASIRGRLAQLHGQLLQT